MTSITVEIGIGREKKTTINLFYRKWTGGVSGDRSQGAQEERLKRHIQYWKSLSGQNRDCIILGDCNLCAKSWHNPDYTHKHLANSIIDYLLEENITQLISGLTRINMRANVITKSCLDHIYTNTPRKCLKTEIIPAGDGDHMVVMVTKCSKEIKTKPRTVQKRSYKYFSPETYC